MPIAFTRAPAEVERKEPGIGGKPPVDRRPTGGGGGGGDDDWQHPRKGPRERLQRIRFFVFFALAGDMMFFAALVVLFFARQAGMHMDARTPDISQLTVNGYRYEVRESGPIDADGRQCYAYRIDNVLLAPTRADTRDGGTGRGAGYNELYLSAAFVPSDDPNPRTVVRGTRIREVRYPMGGIKSPVDGVLHVAPEQLVDRCDSP